MLRRILAIAGLAVRSAVRSRLVACVIVLLLLAIFGIPAVIRGDGTLEGYVRVLLSYSLGTVGGLLAVATLWASSLSMAGDIEGKQIRLVAVKPVRRIEIWLGKWLGLMIMNAALLVLAGALTYALLHWGMQRPQVGGEERRSVSDEILVGRTRCYPRPELTEEEVRREMDRLIESSEFGRDVAREALAAYVARKLQARRASVAPGQSKTWIFDLPHALDPGRTGGGEVAALRFYISLFSGDRRPISGTWTVGAPDRPAFYSYRIQRHLHGTHRFSIPVPAELAGTKQLAVTFANAEKGLSGTATFRIDRNIELLLHESSFESNLLRALLIILCRLGLLAALGLSVGTFLTFPAAMFSATSALIIAFLAHDFDVLSPGCGEHGHGPASPPGTVQKLYEMGVKGLEAAVDPVMEIEALGPLSDGILISWKTAGRAAVLLIGVYSGALALIGGWVLMRRELALPG